MKNYTQMIKKYVYDCCSFEFTKYSIDEESKEYFACTYLLNKNFIVSRTAKITPKKNGQFVTLWKRNEKKIIRPFHTLDEIDFFVVNINDTNNFGQFVFPKHELIRKGIITSDLKEGKRAIRVYPPWDVVTSKQAKKTQLWQLKYFLPITKGKEVDLNKVRKLYS